MHRHIASLRLVVMLLAGVISSIPRAQSLEQHQAALKLITATAEELCADLRLSSSETTITLTADATAKLAGMAKKLTDLGVQAAGAYTRTDRVAGLLNGQVLPAAADRDACKLEVFKTLERKLILSPDKPTSKVSVYCEFTDVNDNFVLDWDDVDRTYLVIDGTQKVPGTHPAWEQVRYAISEHTDTKVGWCRYREGKLVNCTTVIRVTGKAQKGLPNKMPETVGECRRASAPAKTKF